MKKLLIVAVIVLLSVGCSTNPASSNQPSRFTEVYSQAYNGKTFNEKMMSIMKDTQTGACFIVLTGYRESSITQAPTGVCE